MERRNAMRAAMLPGRDPEVTNSLRRYADEADSRPFALLGQPFPQDYTRYQFANRPEVDFPADTMRPLNIRSLMDLGALRLTYPGTGKPGGANTDDEENFSLVSYFNDLAGEGTRGWPTHRRAREFADMLQQNQQPFLYAGKYNQIIDSARRLGMRDEDIFLPNSTER